MTARVARPQEKFAPYQRSMVQHFDEEEADLAPAMRRHFAYKDYQKVNCRCQIMTECVPERGYSACAFTCPVLFGPQVLRSGKRRLEHTVANVPSRAPETNLWGCIAAIW